MEGLIKQVDLLLNGFSKSEVLQKDLKDHGLAGKIQT